MKRMVLLVGLLVGLLAPLTLGAPTFTVGVEQSSASSWQQLGAQFQASTGAALSIQSLAQNAISQQVVFQAFTRSGRFQFITLSESWASSLANYTQDLTADAAALTARGAQIVTARNRSVGVRISFAPGWFLAVLSWPEDRALALDLLVAVAQGSAATTTSASTASATSLTKSKMDRSQHSAKVDGALGALLATTASAFQAMSAGAAAALPSSVLAAAASVAQTFGVPFTAATGTVTVVVEPTPGRSSSSTVAALSALGVSGSSVDAASSLVKITVPISQLSSIISQLAGVSFFRPPYTPYPLATSTQGVAAIGASAYHTAGIRGAGVKVAVIDLGFGGLAQAQARGDLPATLGQVDFTGTGVSSGITHGTAVAEIIHDIAPDAELTLIKIADEVDLDQAVTYCLANGIRIINHSLGWYNTNFYDGTGTICDISRRATSGGILWVNAAGNEAQSHWEGPFVDTNSDGWHDSTISLSATSGSPIILYLTWNDWPAASTDYDLYLYDPFGTLLASSTKYQTGTEEPTESIQTTATSSGVYTIRFQGAGSRSLELYSLYQNVSPAVASSSLLAPADAADVVAVGAISVTSYTTGPQQPYSSQGPTNDGRSKPDLACPDNVATGTAPYTTFQGTSGAAPHAAGAAALLLSQQPSLSGSALRARLLTHVVPMGSPNVYGQGRLSLQPPAPANQPPVASFTVTPSSALVGQSVAFSAAGSSDADGFIVSYAWSFGDGATATGITTSRAYAAPGTYTVTLTVTDNAGASASTTRTVSVSPPTNQPPVASFTATPSSALVGQSVAFSAAGSSDADGFIVSYAWSFGDGATATGITTSRAYAAPGTYTVTLTVTDNAGASASTTRTVTISQPSLPDLAVQSFTSSPASPALGQTLTFTAVLVNLGNASSGTFRTRLDGASLSTNTLVSSIAAGATRTISLTLPLTAASETFTLRVDDQGAVTESNEANNQQSLTVTASVPAPIAEAGGPYSGTVGVPIAFNGLASSGSITTYAWTFGDGGTAVGATPTRAYAAAGTYFATLTVSGPGGQSTDTAAVTVSPAQPALVAGVSLPKATYTVGESIAVTMSVNRTAYVYLCEVTPDNRVVLLFPNLYDQNNVMAAGTRVVSGTVREPVGAETLYVFAATGPIPGFPTSFGLGLPVLSTNPTLFLNSLLATLQTTFTVGNWSYASTSLTILAPTPTTGTLRVLSTPTGATVRLDGTNIGTTNLERTGVAPGVHTVEISRSGYQTETRSVTIVAGSTATVQVTLTAIPSNQAPTASFSFAPPAPNAGTVVQFDGQASSDPDGSIVSYAWTFGDGGTAAGAVVSHAYASTGSYTVQLTVTDNGGRTGSVSKTVNVVLSDEVGWVSPTAFEDPGAQWQRETWAFDNDTTKTAYCDVAEQAWSPYLFLSFTAPGVLSNRVRLMVSDSSPATTHYFTWSVEAEVNGAWVAVYSARPAKESQWFEIAFAQGTLTRLRIRVRNETGGMWRAYLNEVDARDNTVAP